MRRSQPHHGPGEVFQGEGAQGLRPQGGDQVSLPQIMGSGWSSVSQAEQRDDKPERWAGQASLGLSLTI